MPISIFDIRAAASNAKPLVDVQIDGWGEVRLKRLTTPQFVQFAEVMQNAGNSKEASIEALLELVCISAVDDGGDMLFREPEDRQLLADSPAIVMKLGTAAIELNGLSGEPAEKKSVASATPLLP